MGASVRRGIVTEGNRLWRRVLSLIGRDLQGRPSRLRGVDVSALYDAAMESTRRQIERDSRRALRRRPHTSSPN